MNLGKFYETHHQSMRNHGFIYGGRSRTIPLGIAVNKIISNLKLPTILDIGCRDCALADEIFSDSTKINYTGIDIDSISLGRAMKKGYNVINAEALHFLESTTQTFDLILLSEVLEHVIDPIGLLKAIENRLSVGGKLVITVPNAFRLKNRIKFLFGINFEQDYTHLRWYNKQMLKEYGRSSCMQLKQIQYINSRFLFLSKVMFANSILCIFEK